MQISLKATLIIDVLTVDKYDGMKYSLRDLNSYSLFTMDRHFLHTYHLRPACYTHWMIICTSLRFSVRSNDCKNECV